MKKFTNIILALATIALNCGCVNEEDFQNEGSSGIRVYSDLASTRTEHHSENGVTSVSWVEGDRIGLSTSAQSNLCYIADNSGRTSDFTAADAALQAAEGDIVYAYYPYDEWSWPGTETSFHLPNTQGQIYSAGLSYYDVLYAKGTVADNELALHFKHVFAFLKITVPVNKLTKDTDSGCYVVRIVSDQLISNIEGNYNIETSEFEADCTTDVMYWIDQELEGQETVTITAAIMPQTYGTNISIYAWSDNVTGELLRSITVPESGLQAGNVYVVKVTDELQKIEREKAVQALTALYYATDGDNWKNNTNWLSDEPLYKWYGLNANYWPESTIEVDDIVEIQLFDNNLRGTLPPEFAYIMSKARAIQIENNGLNGVIPQEVREHPKWQKFGWNVLEQIPSIGGGFDLSEGTGLVLPECEISFFVEDDIQSSKTVLSKNELTFVFNAGAVDMIEGISDERVNYYLGYRNKGFGIIATVGGYWDYPYDEYKDYVIEKRAMGLPEDISWAKDFQPGGGYGRMQLYDKNANLIGTWTRDYSISETWYLEQMDVLVRKYLGDPEEPEEVITDCATVLNTGSYGMVFTCRGTITDLTGYETDGGFYINDGTGVVRVYNSNNSFQFSPEIGDVVKFTGTWTWGVLQDATIRQLEKSLVKVESLSPAGDLPQEGAIATLLLTVAGNDFTAQIPQDAQSWLTVNEPSVEGDKVSLTLTAAANEGGARSTIITLKTVKNGLDYLAFVKIKQLGVTPAVSVAEFIAAPESEDALYRLTGEVANLKDDPNGCFDLIDETGVVYVSGLTATPVEKNDQSFFTLNIQEGDIISIVGTRITYDENAGVGGPAYFVEKHEGNGRFKVLWEKKLSDYTGITLANPIHLAYKEGNLALSTGSAVHLLSAADGTYQRQIPLPEGMVVSSLTNDDAGNIVFAENIPWDSTGDIYAITSLEDPTPKKVATMQNYIYSNVAGNLRAGGDVTENGVLSMFVDISNYYIACNIVDGVGGDTTYGDFGGAETSTVWNIENACIAPLGASIADGFLATWYGVETLISNESGTWTPISADVFMWDDNNCSISEAVYDGIHYAAVGLGSHFEYSTTGAYLFDLSNGRMIYRYSADSNEFNNAGATADVALVPMQDALLMFYTDLNKGVLACVEIK